MLLIMNTFVFYSSKYSWINSGICFVITTLKFSFGIHFGSLKKRVKQIVFDEYIHICTISQSYYSLFVWLAIITIRENTSAYVYNFIIVGHIANKPDFAYIPYPAITPLFFIWLRQFMVVKCILSIRPGIFFILRMKAFISIWCQVFSKCTELFFHFISLQIKPNSFHLPLPKMIYDWFLVNLFKSSLDLSIFFLLELAYLCQFLL